MLLLLEQLLNGLQFGVMLFLLAAGLTLVFGIMGVINLAHGSLFMVGAYAAAATAGRTGSFALAALAALVAAGVAGLAIEFLVIRRLYDRDHLDQVLATFGLHPVLQRADARPSPAARRCSCSRRHGSAARSRSSPACRTRRYRLAIIAAGLAVAAGLCVPHRPHPARHADPRRRDPPRRWSARSASTSGCCSRWCSRWARCLPASPA